MTRSAIGLNELIDRLREELLNAKTVQQPLFAIREVEIEISFVVERTANGGIDLHVLQAGAEQTSTHVQTVRVTLESLATPDDLRANLTGAQRQAANLVTQRSYEPGETP